VKNNGTSNFSKSNRKQKQKVLGQEPKKNCILDNARQHFIIRRWLLVSDKNIKNTKMKNLLCLAFGHVDKEINNAPLSGRKVVRCKRCNRVEVLQHGQEKENIN